ncbi:Aste57867_15498 [Aphanomyces stellatus]|uniref:Aste57867_15498 protein n=1 Tax=Aphanomyces stellatus TaxID=120398 RepID=A0A485L397_9STRA|nr:hypothetical protein As57867_015442 [Aphanomyces stellatus]VFT92300.1 Aste57867_15498 [Aphanomyces stellatus]
MAGTRLQVLLSVLLPILLIAPYAYHLLLVPRSPLPFDGIQALDLHASTETLRLQLDAARTLHLLHVKPSSAAYPTLPHVSTVPSSVVLSALPSAQDTPETMDRVLHAALADAHLDDRAVLVLLCRDENATITMGKHRHGWSTACRVSTEQQQLLLDTLFPAADPTAKRPSLQYRLSFSVLNEVPHANSTVAAAWEAALASSLSSIEPFATAISSALADVTMDSQLLQYGKLAKNYRVDPASRDVYVTTDDLQHFKAANDFATSSVLSDREHVLHFMAAIPASPTLHIRSTASVASARDHAFLIPGYGGVAIAHRPEDMPHVMRVFLFQCRHMLGLQAPPPSMSPSSVRFLPSSDVGVTEWEIDLLVHAWLLRHWHTSVQTLQSIAALVQQMPQMTVLPRIQTQVTHALALLESVSLLRGGLLDPVTSRRHLATIRAALAAVEAAYYDPTMISQLYFPEDQIYAVYLPLLVPLVIPLLGGLVREVKRYRAKTKQKQM